MTQLIGSNDSGVERHLGGVCVGVSHLTNYLRSRVVYLITPQTSLEGNPCLTPLSQL